MDSKKIGEYITKKRKEKKKTQQELADKIHVSVKAISKWECGKGLPEITNLQMLAKELDVSIVDILNGEDSKKEEVVVEYVKKKEKKNMKKIIFLYIMIILLLIIIILGSYFVCNFNKIYAYRLSGENENFSFDSGFVLESNYSNIISTGNINIKDKKFEKSISIINIELKYNDKKIVSGNDLHNKTSLSTEKNGYNELLTKNNKDGKWYLEITYLLEKKITKEVIELKTELIFRNNKLDSKPVENVSERESTIIGGLDYSYALGLREYLINEKGFHEHKDDFGYVTKTHKAENDDLISSIHVLPFSGVIRGVFNFDESQITLNYSYYNIETNKKLNNKLIQLSGEYPKLTEEDKDNKKDHSEKYFTILFNIETEESECTYGKCPDNSWEISKFIYSELSYIWEY